MLEEDLRSRKTTRRKSVRISEFKDDKDGKSSMKNQLLQRCKTVDSGATRRGKESNS